MSTTLSNLNGKIYLSKSGGYPDLVFKDLDDLYCYVMKTKGFKIGNPESKPFIIPKYSIDDFDWMKKSACDHVMAHLDALKELNKETKEEEHVNVYNQPTIIINTFTDEWGYRVSNGKVILNKEFRYRDEADDMIRSIHDAEYIFITDDIMCGVYRRMKCTNYGVNYALDANEVLLTLVYAD